MQPLFDIDARVLSIGGSLSVERVIDALLRLQNSTTWAKPITVYLGIADRVQQPSLGAIEAVQVCTVMRSIRSPIIRTIGMGFLKGYEPLVLAAGTRGERYLLQHAALFPTLACQNELPVPAPVPGLGQDKHSIQEELYQIHLDQVASLCVELAIPCQWQRKVLLAESAISAGFADILIPMKAPLPQIEPQTVRLTQSQPELSLEYQR